MTIFFNYYNIIHKILWLYLQNNMILFLEKNPQLHYSQNCNSKQYLRYHHHHHIRGKSSLEEISCILWCVNLMSKWVQSTCLFPLLYCIIYCWWIHYRLTNVFMTKIIKNDMWAIFLLFQTAVSWRELSLHWIHMLWWLVPFVL